MGWPCIGTKFPRLNTLISQSQNLFLAVVPVKDIFILLLLSYLQNLIRKVFCFRRDEDDFQPEDRPPASLVPVPSHLTGEAIKKQLPVRRGGCFIGKDSVCVVCMNNMDSGDEVRELCNCCHVFHKECLDVWIGQGQGTCPLCRSNLSPVRREELGVLGVDDPWRMERMVYLFGEDYVFMDTH
jgi:RING-H2 zinc finger protein RHA1